MPLARIKFLPVDPAGFEIAEASWDWWDVDPGVKIVIAHLQAQGPSAAPGDVKRLQADANGNLRVTTLGTGAGVNITQEAGGLINAPAFDTSDGQGAAGGQFTTLSRLQVFNGSTFDRLRSPSAANVGINQSAKGGQIVARPSVWSASSNPAVGTAASASRAAAGGAVHVLQSITAILSSQVAIAASAVVINMRDGASGAGSIFESYTVQLPAAIVAPFLLSLENLDLSGSVGTAMTVEGSAAIANLGQSITIRGYDVV